MYSNGHVRPTLHELTCHRGVLGIDGVCTDMRLHPGHRVVPCAERDFRVRDAAEHAGFVQGSSPPSHLKTSVHRLTWTMKRVEERAVCPVLLPLMNECVRNMLIGFGLRSPTDNDRYVSHAPDNPKKVRPPFPPRGMR